MWWLYRHFYLCELAQPLKAPENFAHPNHVSLIRPSAVCKSEYSMTCTQRETCHDIKELESETMLAPVKAGRSTTVLRTLCPSKQSSIANSIPNKVEQARVVFLQ